MIRKKLYSFTLKPDDFVKETDGEVFEYTYANDKLVSYNDELFEYDVIGNPTVYRGNALTWRFGRRLTTFGDNSFNYDAEGKRILKNDITFTYDSDGRLIKQSNGIEFINDGKNIIGIEYGANRFFYRRDLLGNVIALLDISGNIVVKYTYSGFATCIGTAFGVFGTINNIVNSVYYNFISDGHSELTPTSYHDGYINRWERLDLTKQETGDVWYNLNALRYYGEYNTHMYGWFLTGWAHEKEIFLFSGIAESAYEADVDGQIWESGENWWRNIIYLIAGFLGI